MQQESRWKVDLWPFDQKFDMELLLFIYCLNMKLEIFTVKTFIAIALEIMVYLWDNLRLKCYYAFFLVCCGCDTSYIVSIHIQIQASIYTYSLWRGHSWRVRLAKQETLTPPGHLVSPLVCRGSWMSTVVLYCWCKSGRASVLLYFTNWPWPSNGWPETLCVSSCRVVVPKRICFTKL